MVGWTVGFHADVPEIKSEQPENKIHLRRVNLTAILIMGADRLKAELQTHGNGGKGM